MKAVLEHRTGESLWLEVLLEGDGGTSLNAASVVLELPDASALLLDYDADSCRYCTSLSSPPSGIYILSASSRALAGLTELVIDFRPLVNKPLISDISDSLGASSGAGETLTGAEGILVQAEEISDAGVYRLTIYAELDAVYSVSSTGSQFLLPSETLGSGYYTAIVEAQSISGDPLLREENYYTVSSAQSSSFLFSVE